MSRLDPTSPSSISQRDEFVTIIAASMAEVMGQFRARGLGAMGFAIAGPVGRHQFAFADDGGAKEMFDGQPMLAATFTRRVPTA